MRVAAVVPVLLGIAPLLGAPADPARAVSILRDNCFSCHSGAVALSELKLDTRDALIKGGKRGTAFNTAAPGSSRLLKAIAHAAGEPAMPPGKKLSADEIAVLTDWVAASAPWPGKIESAAPPSWWAFRKPVRPAVPAGAANPVDAFVNAKLAERKLTASPVADKFTLLRRVTFDLHGLAPTAQQAEKFLADSSPDAWEKLIDELLASPRYGERWARHWLDLVRYGDTAGFEQDPYLLYAWAYRDYVIKAFNDDKPYDRFIKEQIGGDELYPEDPLSAAGTGYFTVGPNRDMLYKVEDINRVETMTDFVDTTGSVFLGLTVGCARCHDHKFDPIPQRDYYRLQAIFEPIEKSRVFMHYDMARGYDLADVSRQWTLRELGDQLDRIFAPHRKKITDGKTAKLPADAQAAFAASAADRTPEQRALVEKYRSQVGASQDEMRGLLSQEENERLRAIERRLVTMFTGFKAGPFSPGVRDIAREGPKTIMPARPGQAIGEIVTPGFLTALGGGDVPEPAPDATSTGRRAALAKWIASADNPLTARVFVNRVWQYHFGRGLVATTSDFGTRSGTATHPELLDWLATEFVTQGWSVKKLHKTILMSEAWRRSATPSAEANANDPLNLYLTHANRRRLTPEEMRDSVLEASGGLNLKMYGRPVVTPVDPQEMQGLSMRAESAWVVNADKEEHRRRSIYLFNRRTFRPAMFETFDGPDGIRTCPRRESSNTAPQSLTMLNGAFTMEESRRLAGLAAADPVHDVYRRVFARDPDAKERELATAFLSKQTTALGSTEAAAAELARALFNTNEFLYVD